MHHALGIQEILLIVFRHLDPTGPEAASLAALARTCHAFKEPALDTLWRELVDSSPLARCLPEASHQQQTTTGRKKYSFSRPLTPIEWGTLRGYTRRILSITDDKCGLDWKSVSTLLNPVIACTEPLLPNLRHLTCGPACEIEELLCMPFPSLNFLRAELTAPNMLILKNSLESLHNFSPNVRKLFVSLCYDDEEFDNFFFSCIRRWRELQTVDYRSFPTNLNALAHLSHIPTLTQLTLALGLIRPVQLLSLSDSVFLFSNLQHLTLRSDELWPISWVLCRARLPAIGSLTAIFDSFDHAMNVRDFLNSVQASDTGHTIQRLSLSQVPYFPTSVSVLGFEDLQICMTFGNLRHINLDIRRKVDLKSNDMLTLASAWPRLEHLLINETWGWNMLGGIIPSGLLQLLRICPLLSKIALALDVRNYTESPLELGSLGLTLSSEFSIDVLDSVIEAESVPAVAAFFASIAPCPGFSLHAWRMRGSVYADQWNDVYMLANEAVVQRSRLFENVS